MPTLVTTVLYKITECQRKEWYLYEMYCFTQNKTLYLTETFFYQWELFYIVLNYN